MQTQSFSELLTLAKGLTGNTTLQTDEDTLITAFVNRRIYNAYRRSHYWPRYLVLGEARAIDDCCVPFTQESLDSVDTFLRIYDAAPYGTTTISELDFLVTEDGALVTGDTSDYTAVYVDYKKRWDGDYNTTTNTLVPLEFYHYAAHGAAADWLRYDHQNEKADASEGFAESLLALELRNVMNQKNHTLGSMRIRNHLTTQSRS